MGNTVYVSDKQMEDTNNRNRYRKSKSVLPP